MRVFHIEVGVVSGNDHVILKPKFGYVLGRYFVTFHGAVTLALEVFDGHKIELRIFRLSYGFHVLAHTP